MPSLFGSAVARSGGLVAAVKSAMNAACSESQLSREQIVDRMNDLSLSAGVRITSGNSKSLGLATLEKWLNPADREHVPSLVAVNMFCSVLQDYRPLSVQLEMHGLELMTLQERRLRDYGHACIEAKKARALKRTLEAKL